MDAILIYVQHSSDPEFVLKSMIVQGLDVPGAKSNLTVNVMECVPVVLQQIVKRNGERPVSILQNDNNLIYSTNIEHSSKIYNSNIYIYKKIYNSFIFI